MTEWRVARSIAVLQSEVNRKYPDRPRGADGTIGDARHQAEKSDHNPNSHGVVTAWDITTDDRFTDALADWLAGSDDRVKYVIFKGRIWTPGKGWHPYMGFSRHFDHIHLSVECDPAKYDNVSAWNCFPTEKVSRLATLDKDDLAAIDAIVKKYAKAILGNTKEDDDATHVSLADLSRKIDGKP